MDPELIDQVETLKATLRQLPKEEQDHLASFLFMERLKRNKLVMPTLHQRIEDADADNWKSWEKTKDSLKDD